MAKLVDHPQRLSMPSCFNGYCYLYKKVSLKDIGGIIQSIHGQKHDSKKEETS